MKKYKILPKEAIIRFFILIILLIIMLIITDNIMPQYENWSQDDETLSKEREYKDYMRVKDYPLIELTRKAPKIQENKKKILIIGDSYIDGDGFSNINYTWWRQLELELYNRGYYDVEVYAVGKGGASTYDEMKWFTETKMIEEINPDIIIMGYVINDPEIDNEKGETVVKHAQEIDYFSINNCTKKIKKLFPNITYKINNMINEKVEQKMQYNDETGYPYNMWYDVIINEKWRKIYDDIAIKPLGEYLNSLNTPSFIVTTPNNTNDQYEEWYKVLELFENSNIKTYNLFEEFKNAMKNSKDNYNKKANPVNGHPGTLYTNFFAKYIANILESDYSETLGKKYDEKIEYPIFINNSFPSYNLNLEITEMEDDCIKCTITYPQENNMLMMPIRDKYIKLSLQYPVSINEIKIQGEALENTKLYITTINQKLGYDDQTMKKIGTQKGSEVTFDLKGENLVTSICIHTNIPEKEQLEIIIKK